MMGHLQARKVRISILSENVGQCKLVQTFCVVELPQSNYSLSADLIDLIFSPLGFVLAVRRAEVVLLNKHGIFLHDSVHFGGP